MLAEPLTNRLPRLEPLLQEVQRLYPAEAAGFASAISRLSEPWIEEQRAGRLLQPSRLTPCGFPFELNARSDSPELCYTVEPSLPQAHWSAQLPSVRKFTGIDLASDERLSVFLQQGSPRFGCWLSLRHSKEAVAGKAYLEAGPSTHEHFSHQLCKEFPGLPAEFSFVPMLAGIYPGVQGISEYYVRILRPNRSSLQKLFACCDVSQQLSHVLCLLAELASVQSSHVLECIRLGASLRVQAGKPAALTLFLHAPQLFTSNVQARTRILSLARQLGGALPLYEAVSACLLEQTIAAPLHSVISLKIGSKNLSCSVGYSPAPLY